MADGSIHQAVPSRVLDEMKKQVREGSNKGESAWRAAPKTEDTITGHWGAYLAVDWSEPIVAEGYSWRYRIDYRKFSGSTEEPGTGSDGIFQIEVERFDIACSPAKETEGIAKAEVIDLSGIFRKGILFQAKKYDNTKREEMVEQLRRIERLTPSNGAYFEYGPNTFRAVTASQLIDVNGFTSQLDEADYIRLGDFLADEFLECKHGVEGMFFDFQSEILYFPHGSDYIARIQYQLKHGFRIRVQAIRFVGFNEASNQIALQREGP